MNRKQMICLSIFIIISVTGPVLANTGDQIGNQANDINVTSTPNGSSMNGNVATTGNVAIVTETPISDDDKTRVTNIAINVTVNIGVNNPTIIDVVRDKDKKEDLRVRVKDPDTEEIIVVIVTPEGEAKADVPPPVFTETANSFTGKHVSFQFTKDSITDYTVEGKLIFKSINLGFMSTKVSKVGTELRISNDKNMVIIHDDDEGIMTEKSSENIQAFYKVSPDINIKLTGNGKRVDFSNNIKASILSNDPDSDEVLPSVSDDTVTIKIKNGGLSRFVATHITADEFENRIIDGIALKQIGTIINIDSEESHDISAINVDTTINKVITNTVSLSVNSATPEGKIIALRVNKDILKDLNLRTLVDGDEIQKAKDFDDLFKNDKLSYLIVIGQEIEVLISIPKFSEHQIIVTSEAPTTVMTTSGTSIGTSATVVPTTPAENGLATATQTMAATPSPKSPGFTIGLILAVMTVLYLLIKRKK